MCTTPFGVAADLISTHLAVWPSRRASSPAATCRRLRLTLPHGAILKPRLVAPEGCRYDR